MKAYEDMSYHPDSERLVQILCTKTQNDNPLFFRVLVGFYFCQVASMMRVKISTHDRGEIPVNMYAMNLSTSGTGKGFSTGIMENSVIHLFRQRFLDETFPLLAEDALPKLAVKRAGRTGEDPDEVRVKVDKEFNALGALAFTFDSATPPAVKQLRHKLLMADAGSLNLQIDEIGSNLIGSTDVLNLFLELYDQGMIKQKLTKNTAESSRNEEIIGKTPTNMLLFGTPAKLLNGSKTEEELYEMLEAGYARRCMFGFMPTSKKITNLTPEQVYTQLTDKSTDLFMEQFADRLEALADVINANKVLKVSKETSLTLIEYKLNCERLADTYPEHEEVRKAELSHRYFKALKLAGAYAFIDGSPELTEEHLYQAIKLAEESGESFAQLLSRDRPYVKLAKYLGAIGNEVTLADLNDDLPFFRGSISQKNEMLTLATAWGYKNNIIIKKAFNDGIEFLRGETLKETNLNKLKVSYSTELASNYQNDHCAFEELHLMTQQEGFHWITHHLNHGEDGNGHRSEDHVLPGFSLVVLDIDGTVNLSTAQLLLKDYKYMMYTTKSHTNDDHHFRIILPTNYELKLDAKDFKEFMNAIYESLPFDVDTVTGQRARKWASHDGQYFYNDGQVLDVLPFIPKTSKNEERKLKLQDQQSMDNLERWVLNNSGDGNRNNMLLRYAMILVDAGFQINDVQDKVIALNSKMPDKLDVQEIVSTIMVSVAKAIAKRP